MDLLTFAIWGLMLGVALRAPFTRLRGDDLSWFAIGATVLLATLAALDLWLHREGWRITVGFAGLGIAAWNYVAAAVRRRERPRLRRGSREDEE